jgi:amino acid permease
MASFRHRLNQDIDAAHDPKEDGYTVREAAVLSHNSEPLAAVNTGLHRGLKARQISMIALGGAIGSE